MEKGSSKLDLLGGHPAVLCGGYCSASVDNHDALLLFSLLTLSATCSSFSTTERPVSLTKPSNSPIFPPPKLLLASFPIARSSHRTQLELSHELHSLKPFLRYFCAPFRMTTSTAAASCLRMARTFSVRPARVRPAPNARLTPSTDSFRSIKPFSPALSPPPSAAMRSTKCYRASKTQSQT